MANQIKIIPDEMDQRAADFATKAEEVDVAQFLSTFGIGNSIDKIIESDLNFKDGLSKLDGY